MYTSDPIYIFPHSKFRMPICTILQYLNTRRYRDNNSYYFQLDVMDDRTPASKTVAADSSRSNKRFALIHHSNDNIPVSPESLVSLECAESADITADPWQDKSVESQYVPCYGNNAKSPYSTPPLYHDIATVDNPLTIEDVVAPDPITPNDTDATCLVDPLSSSETQAHEGQTHGIMLCMYYYVMYLL